ncbi:MAG: pyridoxine 5'-phosphate synthase [Vicinamibacterales bacterium]
MIALSVNVNKVATIRNSRGGAMPSVLEAARVCLDAGAHGITVHPRADARHITPSDVRQLAALLATRAHPVEFNVEGDPRPDLLDLVLEVVPHQCTLVPVLPGEITSQAGWTPESGAGVAAVVRRLHAVGIRVSLFVDPVEPAIRWAADTGAERVELYTEPFARAFERGPQAAEASFADYARAAECADRLGLAINAGHDLDVDNLAVFRRLPHLAEVSIGHALISRALFVGLSASVRAFLDALSGP